METRRSELGYGWAEIQARGHELRRLWQRAIVAVAVLALASVCLLAAVVAVAQ